MQEKLHSLYKNNATVVENIESLQLSDKDVLVMVNKKNKKIDFFIPLDMFNVHSALFFGYTPLLFCKKVIALALPQKQDFIDNQCITR